MKPARMRGFAATNAGVRMFYTGTLSTGALHTCAL
jgi:hypothetical protein